MEKTELAKKIKTLRLLEDDVFETIFRQVENIEPLDGVRQIAPNMAIIKLSNLKSYNLSCEYYIAESQKNAVRTVLKRCGKDIAKITQKIEEMLHTKTAFYNNGKDARVQLNENTLEVLQEMFDVLK